MVTAHLVIRVSPAQVHLAIQVHPESVAGVELLVSAVGQEHPVSLVGRVLRVRVDIQELPDQLVQLYTRHLVWQFQLVPHGELHSVQLQHQLMDT